jgi:hypothetical protein
VLRGRGSDRESGGGHSHNLAGHAARLMLKWIADPSDREFRLDNAWQWGKVEKG